MNIRIRYIDGRRLKRSIIVSAQRILDMREELNEINVFPVADGDTGTNMAATMHAIIDRAAACQDGSLSEVCRSIADGALEGSRGNSGAILAQFFSGLADACEGRERLSSQAFADAVHVAVERAFEALSNPREGTILTVMQDWAKQLNQQAEIESDYVALLQDALQRARISLAETPQKLKVLKKAGVVDAGAQGFVHLLEGLSDFISSGKVAALKAGVHLGERIKGFHLRKAHGTIRFRYCTEFLLEAEALQRATVQDKLNGFGDSLIIVSSGRRWRVHIHTNDPQAVFAQAAQWGPVSNTKIEDMRGQHSAALARDTEPRIALVTDSTCDLPEETLHRYRVQVVPVQVMMGEKTLLDRVEISTREIYRALKAGQPRISTSQPSPASYLAIYEALAGRFQSIISLHLSGALSGTLNAAQTAARSFAQRIKIEVMDSRTTSVGLGLLVAEAGRLIEQGFNHEDVSRRLHIAIAHSRLFVCIPTLHYLMRSGRLTKSRGLLATLMNVKPIISLDSEGRIIEAGRVIGLKRLWKKTVGLSIQYAEQVVDPRIQIAHALNEERAEWFRDRIRNFFPGKDIPIVEASPALGLHAGIGSIAVAILGDPAHQLRV